MNKFERLAVIGGLATAALAISACSTENQVNGNSIVECKNGRQNGEIKLTLPFEKEIEIAGTGPGFDNRANVYVSISKGRGIALRTGYPWKVIYFPDGEPQLATQEVGIDKTGTVYIRDLNISYVLSAELDSSGGSLDIKATCVPK